MTPVGGTGMNTAIQAAHNLGWKLAWVARGLAGDALLDSYESERRRAGERERAGRCVGGPPSRARWSEDLGVRTRPPVSRGAARERAPHAWVRDGRRRSHARPVRRPLTLLVGRDAAWCRAAADRVAGAHTPDGGRLEDALVAYVLGGAVLVRPDGYVAWRAATTECPEAQLRAALDLTLGRVAAVSQAA